MNDEMDDKPTFSVEKLLWKLLPYYLSIGMPASEYWTGDTKLHKAYREAHEIIEDRRNFHDYRASVYMYDQYGRLLNMFGKSGKPMPHLDKPYARNQEQADKEDERETKNQALKEKAKAQLNALRQQQNK